MKTHLPFQLVPKSFWEQDCKVGTAGTCGEVKDVGASIRREFRRMRGRLIETHRILGGGGI